MRQWRDADGLRHARAALHTIQFRPDLIREDGSHRLYKTIRHFIPQALPLWPLGLPLLGDHWLCYGLETKTGLLLAVWRLGGEDAHCMIRLPQLKGRSVVAADIIYPKRNDSVITWDEAAATLHLNFPAYGVCAAHPVATHPVVKKRPHGQHYFARSRSRHVRGGRAGDGVAIR